MSEDSGPTDAGQMTGKQAVIWTWLVSMAATTGLICLYARWGWQGVVTGAALATALSLFAASRGVDSGRTRQVRPCRAPRTGSSTPRDRQHRTGRRVRSRGRLRRPAAGRLRARAHVARPPTVATTPSGAGSGRVGPQTSPGPPSSGGRPSASTAPRDRRPDVVPRLARQLRPAQRRQLDGGSPFRRSAPGELPGRAVSPIPSRARCVVRVRSPRIQQPAPLPHRPGQSS